MCGARNAGLVQELGAARTIHYDEDEDFASGGETYDVIFDVVANTSYRACKGRSGPAESTSPPSPAPGSMQAKS